jgi:hypothetical protein
MKAVLERYFEAMRACDWPALAETLAEDVHRTGPFLDEVRGRDAYVEFLAGVIPKLPELRARRRADPPDRGRRRDSSSSPRRSTARALRYRTPEACCSSSTPRAGSRASTYNQAPPT